MEILETDRRVLPGPRSGTVSIPASKSRAHRLLIMAALSKKHITLKCSGISNDIQATVDCLKGLGYEISQPSPDIICIGPGTGKTEETERAKDPITLYCRDSGSTLRFMMPFAGAMGKDVIFKMEGRLPERPLAPYDEELMAHGMQIRRDGDKLYCSGRLKSGEYTLPGNVSSQYISGLLMSLPMLRGSSSLKITGNTESRDYIIMTLDALSMAGIKIDEEGDTFFIEGGQEYKLPETVSVEGDWSGAAFFLSMGALSPAGITVKGVDSSSLQGDRAMIEVLEKFGAKIEKNTGVIRVSFSSLNAQDINAEGIPDLVPVISVVAAAAHGTTRITGAGRLRLKESDRLKTTTAMLKSLGADITEEEDSLTIKGAGYDPYDRNGGHLLSGGRAESFNDHRIAMSAAVAASFCRNAVYVSEPECVKKSYAAFWEDLEALEMASDR